MNRGQIVTEVIGQRFDTTQTTSVQRWVDLEYAAIWHAEDDWIFRQTIMHETTITLANWTPTSYPADLGEIVNVYHENGDAMEELTQEEFDPYYLNGVLSGTRGRPEFYEVLNNQLTFYPTTDKVYNIRIEYQRKLSHYQADGVTVVPGPFSADTDLPLWDADHHYLIVMRAFRLGCRMSNDPTGELVNDNIDEAMDAMRRSLLVEHSGEQYGRVED